MAATNPSSEFSQREHLFSVQLRQLLVNHFSLEELKTLCFEINFTYDELGGEGINAKARELVSALQRQNQIPTLATAALKKRPNIAWPSLVPPDTESPYRGLHAFQEKDEHLFFGREVFSQRLLQLVPNQHLVAVIGSSGSGKSSAVYAGLLPQLRRQGNWLIAQCRPGRDPIYNLAKALVDVGDKDKSRGQKLREIHDLVEQLSDQENPLPLMDVINDILPQNDDARLLLFVDQFEELYTLHPDQTSQHQFLDLLIKALSDNEEDDTSSRNLYPNRFHLILTLRADFLGQALDYRTFTDALQDKLVTLGPMNLAELKRAIMQPAHALGIRFETGLVTRILDEVADQGGSLPLLEFALRQLWEWQSSNSLTHVAYESIGQVKGALAEHAEQVYVHLSEGEQAQARQILVQLVRPGLGTEDTRQQATRADLGEAAWVVVQRLAAADARLLVTARDELGTETVDLAHEALILSWDRLQGWINADREFLTWREQLRSMLMQWEQVNRDEGALLRGFSLEEARKWLGERRGDTTNDVQNFIRESIAVHEKNSLVHNILTKRVDVSTLQGVDLSRADLGGANLHRADLSKANLSKANLSGANLYEVNLSRANLSGADLSGADLRGTMVDETTQIDTKWRLVWEIVNQGVSDRDLSGVDLCEADLREADLNSTYLFGANLRSADLFGANLRSANLSEADLREADLREADLREADLREADLHGAMIDERTKIDAKWRLVWDIVNQGVSDRDLSGADLRGANLGGANLSGANLSGAMIDERTKIDAKWRLVWEIVNLGVSDRDLRGADLSGANLSDIDLTDVDLSSADLSRTNLSKTYLFGANLRSVNLNGASLSSSSLYCADLSGANLSYSSLSNADLSGANLSGADLSKTDLNGIDLFGAILDERTKIDAKWRLVWEIVNQKVSDRNLRGANLRGANLRRADLRSANMRNADMRNADMNGGNMSGTDLFGANLSAANLYWTNLRLANLSRADLFGAILIAANLYMTDLHSANLHSADLSYADLGLANLSAANLNEANLSATDLRFANLSRTNLGQADLGSADLRGAILNKSDLIGANLRGTYLGQADLGQADLSKATLSSVNLSGADLFSANLSGADLFSANLSDAGLFSTNLNGADLRRANLRRADLRLANLRRADLRRADLRLANLRGAMIDKTTQIDAKWRLVWEILKQGASFRYLSGANLSGANLQRAELRHADLSGANLFGADLRGADLNEADLRLANLFGANLFGANLRGADLNEAFLRFANLSEAKFSTATIWSEGFDPAATGAILVDE